MTGLRPLVAVATAAFLYGCGGGSSPAPPAGVTTTVSGTVVVGTTATSGAVAVYDYSSGSKGAWLGGGPIAGDGSGHYSISYTSTSPPSVILVEATNACYDEFSYLWYGADFGGIPQTSTLFTPQFGFAPVCATPSLALDAVAAVTSGSSATVAVTPYTHADLGLIQYKVRNGEGVAAAVADAATAFKQMLGFDPVTTLPAMPQHVETESPVTVYGGLIAAIPGWLYNAGYAAPSNTSLVELGTPPLTTLSFAELMRSDLAEDGVLNGVGRDSTGAPVSLAVVGVPLSTDVYRHGLAKYAVGQLRGYFESVQGYTVADTQRIIGFLPELLAYNDATSPVFDSTAVTPLDENYPLINFASPASGATLTGSPNVNGYIADIVGVSQTSVIPTNCILQVDGTYYDSFSDPYHPNHFVNTTVFANGTHILTIQVTNNLGATASSSASVTFSN